MHKQCSPSRVCKKIPRLEMKEFNKGAKKSKGVSWPGLWRCFGLHVWMVGITESYNHRMV